MSANSETTTAAPRSEADNDVTESVLTGAEGVEVQSPEFQNFSPHDSPSHANEISRFADIKVTVSAELGRAKIPIQRLLSLGNGSVLALDRTIESPIELIAQGVPLASGEVVVVDGCFGIRITKVYPRNRKGESLPVE